MLLPSASSCHTILKYVNTFLHSRRVDTVPTCPGAVNQKSPKDIRILLSSQTPHVCPCPDFVALTASLLSCATLKGKLLQTSWPTNNFRFHITLSFKFPCRYKPYRSLPNKKSHQHANTLKVWTRSIIAGWQLTTGWMEHPVYITYCGLQHCDNFWTSRSNKRKHARRCVGGSISVTDGHSNVQLNAIKKHLAGSKNGATLLLYPGEGGARFKFRPCYEKSRRKLSFPFKLRICRSRLVPRLRTDRISIPVLATSHLPWDL
jgi:hypothetical protein